MIRFPLIDTMPLKIPGLTTVLIGLTPAYCPPIHENGDHSENKALPLIDLSLLIPINTGVYVQLLFFPVLICLT